MSSQRKIRGRCSGWGRLRAAQFCPFCFLFQSFIPIMFEFTKSVESLGKDKYHQTIVYQLFFFFFLVYDVRTIHSLDCLFFITFVIATHNYFKVTFPSFSKTAVKIYLLHKLLSVSTGFKKVKVFSPNFKTFYITMCFENQKCLQFTKLILPQNLVTAF